MRFVCVRNASDMKEKMITRTISATNAR